MIVLNRYCSDLFGTYGLIIDCSGKRRKPLCHTFELPWLGNLSNTSCIPVGDYEVVKGSSPRYGSIFYVKDVPDREGILIHPGNTLKDTRGCILPGLDISDNGVLQSKLAMDRLLYELPYKFKLTIRNGT